MERRSFEQQMAWGANQYRDVLDALAKVGLDGTFTQTGGMCAALEITLDGGFYLLLTDAEDTLSWDRESHEGWYVAMFQPQDRQSSDEPIAYAMNLDGSAEVAVGLVLQVITRGVGR